MRLTLIACFLTAAAHAQQPAPVMLFDFTQGAQGWVGAHAVSNFRSMDEGIAFEAAGEDPYIWGEPVPNMPLGDRVLLTIRLKSDTSGGGQFFFGRQFSGEKAENFNVEGDGQWHEYDVLLPAQESGTRLRFDPPGDSGSFTIAWIKALLMKPLMKAEFDPPVYPTHNRAGGVLVAGDLTVAFGEGGGLGDFTLSVGEQEMAHGHVNSRMGFLANGAPTYLYLTQPGVWQEAPEGTMSASLQLKDDGGATWTVKRVFRLLPDTNAVRVVTTVTVDQDRDVFHLPMLTLFPGLGTFGEEKTQAMLPGVEYLANEPSSSEADVKGPKANRRVVDDYKLCFPMMSIVQDGRYIALAWDRDDHPAPVFDSPDTTFKSGAHLMGLWYPAVGKSRIEGDFDIFRPFTVKAGEPVKLTAYLLGGKGETVNAPVEHYVALRGGLPELPAFEFQDAVTLLAHGWLDSALNEGGKWRHAVWGNSFQAAPVADAAGYMLWLAEFTDDEALAQRLVAEAKKGLEVLGSSHWEASCSHVTRPFVPLLFGDIVPYAERKLANAKSSLRFFDDEGLVHYRPQAGKPDYGSTHWEDHANGLSANQLEGILEAAAFTGDDALTENALEILDKQLAVYKNTVPRGAQTWEMPLHTPDILASARVLRCCNLAYQLTGDDKYLEAGRYWAWTGVSMVYMDLPTEGPVGRYATIGVIGATNWAAPYWVGQPVQWCGLVYRSALQDYAKLGTRDSRFWSTLAQGITRSGLQQTFPLSDAERQGLLPDYYLLKPQVSDGPAISPGTIQANLADAFGKTPVYELARVGAEGALLHAPGRISPMCGDDGAIRVKIDGWFSRPYWLRLVNLPAAPDSVQFTGGEVLGEDYDSTRETLDILVKGDGTLVLK